MIEPEMLAFAERSVTCLGDAPAATTLAEQRAQYREWCAAFSRPRPAALTVEDHRLGHLRLRCYHPPERVRGRGAVLYLHGGGWVAGDLDSHDDITAELAMAVGTTLVAVDYRLAPEHPYPAALDDAEAAFDWLTRQAPHWGLDPGRSAVCGDSAGGALAASLALRRRGAAGPAAQVLIYPALGGGAPLPSYREQANAPLLSAEEVEYYWRCYLGGAAVEAEAAPLRASDLRGVAPAWLFGVEYDPLRDDVLAYAGALVQAGVSARVEVLPGLLHGSLRARHSSPGAARLFAAVAAALVSGVEAAAGPAAGML